MARKVVDLTPDAGFLRGAFTDALLKYETRKVSGLPGSILGIDPGLTNLALCYIELPAALPLSAIRTTTTKLDIPNFETDFSKRMYIKESLMKWVQTYRPQVIAKESIAHGMKFGVADAGRMQHIIEEVAFAYNIPFVTINISKMREFMGLKPGQDKSDTKLAIFERYGLKFSSEDEADAFGIGMTAAAALDGAFDLRSKKDQDAAKRAAKKAAK